MQENKFTEDEAKNLIKKSVEVAKQARTESKLSN